MTPSGRAYAPARIGTVGAQNAQQMEATMPGGNALSSVEHVVVLMLENRSFDHMLGFLY